MLSWNNTSRHLFVETPTGHFISVYRTELRQIKLSEINTAIITAADYTYLVRWATLNINGIKLYKIVQRRNIYIPPRFWFAVCKNFLKLFIFKCRLNRTFNTRLATQQMELTAVSSDKTGSILVVICFVLTELFIKILTTEVFDMFHFPPLVFDYRHWKFSCLVTVSPNECKAMFSDTHHSLFSSPYLLTVQNNCSIWLYITEAFLCVQCCFASKWSWCPIHTRNTSSSYNKLHLHPLNNFRNETFRLKKSLTSTTHIVSVLPGKIMHKNSTDEAAVRYIRLNKFMAQFRKYVV